MRALPEAFDSGALIGLLADGWGFEMHACQYLAVGGGSYHWVVDDVSGARGFVNVDDLDNKPWLGDTRESVFDGLRRAFETAIALRTAGLDFVVAPIPTRAGEALRRAGPRHTIALFPYVDGQAGRFGRYSPGERTATLTMLAELHAATPKVGAIARRFDLVAGRRNLDAALQAANQVWTGGPFAEPARQALASRVSDVGALLAESAGLARGLARSDANWVVTHGEPHAANVMRTNGTYMLVDWDTVAVAPPERDLWMLVGAIAADTTSYAAATGHHVSQAGVAYFRLAWDLDDLDAFIKVLRSPHRRNQDTRRAYECICSILARLHSGQVCGSDQGHLLAKG